MIWILVVSDLMLHTESHSQVLVMCAIHVTAEVPVELDAQLILQGLEGVVPTVFCW